VFVISAPARGEQFGYLFDGWADDGYFHYTGEGQTGDQQMTQGNRAVRDHASERRELHVFQAEGTELEYIGRFQYHDDYRADAPEVGDGQLRTVIVFRLEQLTGDRTGPRRNLLDRLGHEQVKEVPIEQYLTEATLVEGHSEPHPAERREQRLVRNFASYLERNGNEVCRYQFRPPGEPSPLYCDLYDKTSNTLYEAKGNVTRHAVRMAIGQLADYGRLTPADKPPKRALLVPSEPRPDLLALATSQGIIAVWPEGDKFETSASGRPWWHIAFNPGPAEEPPPPDA
jgi:hypothetical protein